MDAAITIRLPAALRQSLDELSRESGRPVSDLVRESIERHILLARFRRCREGALPFAEAQGILTDEDIYRIVS